MKTRSKGEKADELRPEYDLGQLLKGGVQGKYAHRYREGTNLVLLAPDVKDGRTRGWFGPAKCGISEIRLQIRSP